MRLSGINALVTGGGSGFGSIIAQALALEGANVLVTYNTSEEGAKAVSEKIKSMGRRTMTVKANISDWEEVKAATENAWTELGPIHVLVNNAA